MDNTCIYWPEALNNDPKLHEGLEGTRADNYYPSHMLCDTSCQVHTERQGCSPKSLRGGYPSTAWMPSSFHCVTDGYIACKSLFPDSEESPQRGEES